MVVRAFYCYHGNREIERASNSRIATDSSSVSSDVFSAWYASCIEAVAGCIVATTDIDFPPSCLASNALGPDLHTFRQSLWRRGNIYRRLDSIIVYHCWGGFGANAVRLLVTSNVCCVQNNISVLFELTLYFKLFVPAELNWTQFRNNIFLCALDSLPNSQFFPWTFQQLLNINQWVIKCK